jgi:hypothetical protein
LYVRLARTTLSAPSTQTNLLLIFIRKNVILYKSLQ